MKYIEVPSLVTFFLSDGRSEATFWAQYPKVKSAWTAVNMRPRMQYIDTVYLKAWCGVVSSIWHHFRPCAA